MVDVVANRSIRALAARGMVELEEPHELSCDLKVLHYYLLTHIATEREALGKRNSREVFSIKK